MLPPSAEDLHVRGDLGVVANRARSQNAVGADIDTFPTMALGRAKTAPNEMQLSNEHFFSVSL